MQIRQIKFLLTGEIFTSGSHVMQLSGRASRNCWFVWCLLA